MSTRSYNQEGRRFASDQYGTGSHTIIVNESLNSTRSQSSLSPLNSSRRNLNATNEDANAVRLNVLRGGVESAEMRANPYLLALAVIVHLPQIIASFIVLGLYWDTAASECSKLSYWVLLHAIFLSTLLFLECVLYYLEHQMQHYNRIYPPRLYSGLKNVRYGTELAGLFWFLVGNMWIISDQRYCEVENPSVYHMALALMFISYIRIFLPCIIFIALLPIVCFCMPCFIRLVNCLHDPMRGKGASKDIISSLDSVSYSTDEFTGQDITCSVCLCDYQTNEKLRVLPCKHHFHQACVDEWLLVNATCPVCRESIIASSSTQPSEQDAVIVSV